ncbi:nuclear transport factor 2 family protein [Conexibacter stalactiti]|uniref:Nuclear transport factor 2 family protein n=1 Tax=Conexibacter stalactiti TaxID=1940611 RepID=A0ABU4HP78_9ACTN|nr:nuclear transport factor 2 family protein [Conexibacter stalactiti]MDW5595118.1 nuclear transport factor 2 family protein [Conexibacter stalactiti]MEC5035760.1 nuclear transport factor 2 family protein [Conexibacter stalactiti]
MSRDAAAVARDCFTAFSDGDLAAFAAHLAPDVVGRVTGADGGVDVLRGRDAYVARIPDLDSAEWKVEVTQVAEVADDLALTAVRVRAHRNDRELQNFAAFLTRVADARITEIWMVEAEPAYSDEFWA